MMLQRNWASVKLKLKICEIAAIRNWASVMKTEQLSICYENSASVILQLLEIVVNWNAKEQYTAIEKN